MRYLLVWVVMIASSAYSQSVTTNDESPSEFHRKLAAAKAERFTQERQAFVAKVSTLDQLKYDALYYDLDLSVAVTTGLVYGRVFMQARSLADNMTAFDLDLNLNMTVDSVMMSGADVFFSHLGHTLFITPNSAIDSGEVFETAVYYHGNPAGGGLGAFGVGTHGSSLTPLVWTLSEPYFARNWWPCKDSPSDKADSVDIHITCRSDMFASSNGVLTSEVDNGDGTKTYHWSHRYPIVTYLVSLAITNYERLDYAFPYNGGLDTMPVYFWVYPERVVAAQSSYPEILIMLDALGQYFGPYPFLKEKYAITHFTGGGMEHQTNTSQSDSWYSWSLNVHELAHQWWGDMITCRTWGHIWLNEGFATWSEALYREWQDGPDAYHSYMNSIRYTGPGSVFCTDTTSVSRIFSGGLSYDKGAWVVHMLRGVLGDSLFFPALLEYRHQFEGKSATTEDFRDACEQATGLDLHEFFDDWVYGLNAPSYRFAFTSNPVDGRYHTQLRLTQIQPTEPYVFDMPVDVLFSDGVNDTLITFLDNERTEVYDAYLPFEPALVEIDPDGWILKYVTQEEFGMAILSDTLEPAYRNFPYADTLEAMGGIAPYTWFLNSSSLPFALMLEFNGTIHGTPYQEGMFTIKVRAYDSSGTSASTTRTVVLPVLPPLYPAGDVTHDRDIRASDIVYLAHFVFGGGPAPEPLFLGDTNMDCSVSEADIIQLVNYVFKGGPAPLEGCAE